MPPAAIVGGKVLAGVLAAKSARDSMKAASSSSGAANDAASLQAQIAQDLYQSTQPIRSGLIDRSTDYLQNGLDSSPLFDAYKSNIEQNYNTARDQTIGATPAGGALTSALTNLEAARARDLTQARGAVDEGELARALSLGTGLTNSTIGAAGNSASILSQLATAREAQSAQALQNLGTGLGAMLGSKGK